MNRRSIFGPWQIVTAAAVLLIAVAIGSWITRPTEGQPTVASSPTGSVGATSATSATPSPTPAPTATPAPIEVDHQRIYFARDGQPPVSAHIEPVGVPPAPEPRIQLRLSNLLSATQVPPGSFSAFSSRTTVGVNSVRVNGDTATVDFRVNGGDWGIRGSAQSLAALQQLVYTATEEPGVRRVLITQNDGGPATIDQLLVNKALTREDVFGYTSRGPIGATQGITWSGEDTLGPVGANLTAVVSDGSTVRLTFEGRDRNSQKANLPSFSVSLDQDSETGRPSAVAGGGKYAVTVAFQWNCQCSSGGVAGVAVYDKTPLRAITSNGNTAYRIAIDDARPWRAYMPDESKLVVEIGGDPRATSERIAMIAPKPGDIVNSGTDLTLTGSARVFEANVVWRLLDSTSKVVANGHFLTSLGSSAMWGTFNTRIAMPAGVRGNLTLEVFEASAMDGSPQGVVQIPLAVR